MWMWDVKLNDYWMWNKDVYLVFLLLLMDYFDTNDVFIEAHIEKKNKYEKTKIECEFKDVIGIYPMSISIFSL